MEHEKMEVELKRSGLIWNFLSGIATAASSVLLLMVIKRFAGIESGASFSVAVAVANVLINIANMNSIGFQISDINEQFNFNTYLKLRKITVIIMLTTALINNYIVSNYSASKSRIVFLYCLYRAIYAYADVYQGRYQQKGRVDLACKLQFFKVLIPDFLLAVSVILFQNVCLSIAIASAAEITFLHFYNAKNFHTFKDPAPADSLSCWILFRQCIPLFFSAFTTTYIINSSKYAIDRTLDSSSQVYYAILLLPATTVHLLAGFIYRPVLTEYSDLWQQKKISEFSGKIHKIIFFMLLATTFLELCAVPVIIPLLKLLYAAPEIGLLQKEFLIILLAGSLNALNTFMCFVITIMRKQSHMFWIYGLCFLISLILPGILVAHKGLIGAAVSFVLLMLLQSFMIFIVYRKGIAAAKI